MTDNVFLSKERVYLARVGAILDSGKPVMYDDGEVYLFAYRFSKGVRLVYRGIDNKEVRSLFSDVENATIAFHALVHS